MMSATKWISRVRLPLLLGTWLLPPLVFGELPSQYEDRREESWFRSDEGRRIADNVLTWQTPRGNWPKNRDTASEPYEGDPARLDGTFDNGATTGELRFLGRAAAATDETRYLQAFRRGIDHILGAQYPTGGWPQFHPPGDGYHRHITFNDGSMVRILMLLRDVAESDVGSALEAGRRDEAEAAFEEGIRCILECQIVVDGERTVWCAQHDAEDLSPRPARSFEPASLSGGESAGILELLMSLEHPDFETRKAIRAGVEWYEESKLTGIRIERTESGDKVVVEDRDAPPLWARFYEIDSNRPIFCGRDGVVRYELSEIDAERRKGYAWYGNWGRDVIETYEKWE